MKLSQVINDCCYSSYCYATARQFSCSEGMQAKHINDQTLTHGLEQQSVKTSENQSNRSIKMVPKDLKLECGPMPNLMVTLPNIGGALCSKPQSLADVLY